ncbi:hypothetical protein, partial [Actinomadura sp. NPDC049753]|uniref:hypothetical protein n=1 Tax=Actinomadura sp. NPDC049753 TaxID=3154739 RepID=UPI00342B35E2
GVRRAARTPSTTPAARAPLARAVGAATRRLHELHSGHVGDYAAWLTAGVAVLALLTTRF